RSQATEDRCPVNSHRHQSFLCQSSCRGGPLRPSRFPWSAIFPLSLSGGSAIREHRKGAPLRTIRSYRGTCQIIDSRTHSGFVPHRVLRYPGTSAQEIGRPSSFTRGRSKQRPYTFILHPWAQQAAPLRSASTDIAVAELGLVAFAPEGLTDLFGE